MTSQPFSRAAGTRQAGIVRPQWRRALWWPAQMQAYLALWSAGVVVVGATVGLIVWSRLGEVDRSIMQNLHATALWFTFAYTIVAVAGLLPVHVSAGLTRRSFTQAMLAVSAATGLGYAALLGVLIAVEGVVYRALDWPHVAGGSSGQMAQWEIGLGNAIAALGLSFLVAQSAALLVAITYYRLGGLTATLLLPLTAGPLAIVMFVMVEASTWQWGPIEISTTSPGAYLLSVGIVLAQVAAFVLLARRVPIRPRT